ncbi:transposase [Phenylobacterium sp. 20VBR1]|uniref:Transposase n=1 Tax=Phenylobacterium glaciei TaxID=2803784 RepID=A0A941HW15_9CAUL|nr:transposase [Phenylobacterium glaciei]MBR7619095.1 transposase [Phenylobacterium glaciei]
MARRARMIFPGLAHHVTQRGNRREPIFFEDGDQQIYLDLLATQLKRYGVACWGYCLMPNHVHLILTPSDETGLPRAVGEAHRRYAAFVGARGGWTGHLFQGRFGSVAMDEAHLLAALRYVPLNPVRAGLVARAQDWPWSSAGAHLAGRDTPYVEVAPALSRVGDFAGLIAPADDIDPQWTAILRAELIGRPVGAKAWIEQLEAQSGRALSPQKRGPKPKGNKVGAAD